MRGGALGVRKDIWMVSGYGSGTDIVETMAPGEEQQTGPADHSVATNLPRATAMLAVLA